jgi:hypothetical protein
MSLNPNEVLIGSVRVSFGGVDLGFTTDDGVEYKPEYETKKFKGAQSTVTVKKHRTGVSIMVQATFAQLTQENIKLLEDLQDDPSGGTLEGIYNETPTERALVVTGPAPNGGTRVLTAVASVDSVGGVKINNKDFQGYQVTFELLGDASTNKFWDMVDTASSATVPTPSSYATVTGSTETPLADAATGINVGHKIQVNFPVSIRPDQANTRNFLLKTSAGNTFVACTVSFGVTASVTDYTKVKLTPVASLTASTEYQLLIVPGVLSADAIPGTGASIQFTTA